MDKDILKGLKIGFGIILSLSLFFGIVFAVGFHNANEIISGTFQGNYTFTNNVNFSNATVVGINSIPSGFVGAFNATECPTGWTNLTEAEGRMIIGIGMGNDGTDSPSFLLEQQGGEYNHTLTVAEMPSHTHTISGSAFSAGGAMRTGTSGGPIGGIINPAGGDGPHNNIPPYLALLYCIKN